MENIEVFLVEDNPADVLLVRVALSQVPFPLKLLVAKDGEQALKMLGSSDFRPQLIILDLNMPRVDGQTRTAAVPADQDPHRDLQLDAEQSGSAEGLGAGRARIRSETYWI